MFRTPKTLAKKALSRFGIAITREDYLRGLEEDRRQLANQVQAGNDIDLLSALPHQYTTRLLSGLRQSRSQLRQDLFVLTELDFKTGGYFVEFGATNGVDLSNSYYLEKGFGWSGIVAEPALRWHTDLRSNRLCHIDTNCVWRESNAVLSFSESLEGEFSTLDSFSGADSHGPRREKRKLYNVKTISLLDLLDKYGAPKIVDYLSIDTEGSEYEILSHFDFDKYRFRVITCEHNFTPQREKLFALLTEKGYVRKFENLSKFDDWYVGAASF